MTNSNNIINVSGLTKIYTMGNIFSKVKISAVDNITFDIKPGEILTLAGESGCGKTTVARIILNFIEATTGNILYKSQDITHIKRKKEKKIFMKEVQAIFQNPFETFNPLRKVEDYLFETSENYGITSGRKEAEEHLESVLRSVGLTLSMIKNKYPSEFSGGQLQRISIARSLITRPLLLVADEPVSMIDASLRMSIVNLFKELKEQYGISVLYITHDLATAYYVSDRIIIMFRGHIVESGSVEDVLRNPKHPYTSMLIESIPEPDPRKVWQKSVDISTDESDEYLTKGCRFSHRCPHVMEICNNDVPDFEVEGRIVKCNLYKD